MRNNQPEPWLWANNARMARAAQKAQTVAALIASGVEKPVIVRRHGIPLRTVNRCLERARNAQS